jgi:hypothetical protein
MHLVGNALNGYYLPNLLELADSEALESIILAVAYVTELDDVFDLAKRRSVPLSLYCLADGQGFPKASVIKRFVSGAPPSWQAYLTRAFYHPKILWFRGVGAYIGSANLTDRARWNNLECGVWFDQAELDSEGWSDQLGSMVEVIRGRSVAATAEHVDILIALSRKRSRLNKAQADFNKEVEEELRNVPGGESPEDPTAGRRGGGAARAKFVQQWQQSLTILRKFAEKVGQSPLPTWIDPAAEPAILQDQATEWWYHHNVRTTGRSEAAIGELHDANKRDPDAVLTRLLDDWSRFDGGEKWQFFANTTPPELRALLSRESLQDLTVEKLSRITLLAHAPKTHARQMKNANLGLPATYQTDEEGRCELFARYLLQQETPAGKRVGEVLQYVIWGDSAEPDVAERIWFASNDPKWRLKHLGQNILGELVGYARPKDYPPRNGRVAKTLTALGYEGIIH